MYQDNKRIQTAEELRRMFNLDDLKKDRKAIEVNKNTLTKINAEQENILKSIIINLGDILENQSDIELWFFNGIPTLENIPYVNWNNPLDHIGDYYYDKDTGYVYQFNDEWTRIEDSPLIQAMALTNAELDTLDGSRKVFFTTPTVPYSNGDWYINENGNLYICQISKQIPDVYNENDFIIASKYTDDTKAYEIAGKLTIVSGQVTTIIQNLNIISQTIEDNRYYVDASGQRKLLSTSMSRIEQTVGQIQQEIGDIADITISQAGTGTLSLDNINPSEPIYLKIYPTGEDISYIYPDGKSLVGKAKLNSRNIIFSTNTYSTYYTIPSDLLRLNNIYDEFTLDYENKRCYVTHRIQKDSNGNKELLDVPYEEEFEYPFINLEQGNYEIRLESFDDGYIFVRLMTSNMYAQQFTTRVELNSRVTQSANDIKHEISEQYATKENLYQNISEIHQTTNEISLNLSQKVDGINYTHAEIVARINDSTSNVLISADKVNIQASNILNILSNNTINLSAKNIKISSNNFNVDANGNLVCSNANISGRITATSGRIADYTIDGAKLVGNNVGLSGTSGQGYAFWAGSNNSAEAPFRVGHDGSVVCNSANISGTISGSSINGSSINGGSINIQTGNYYFNMGVYTSNPNVSGLNVGYYGIKAYSDITATRFAITDSDVGKSYSIGIRDYRNRVHYLTFTGGILTAWDYV